ncbi:MAG: hypothetical protein Q7S40_30615 [Opitutaceae bacterium]|nr:hypothetical protein [Opitutaceae bacterium]
MKPKDCLLCIAVTALAVALFAAAPSSQKAAPAKSKSSAEKKVFELPKEGKNLSRDKGGWLNVNTSGSQMIVKFFDREKKPVPPDVPRAAVRLRYATKSDINRTVLNRKDEALVSPGNVRPPHNFLVTLTLLRGDDTSDDAEAAEIYNFKFPRQPLYIEPRSAHAARARLLTRSAAMFERVIAPALLTVDLARRREEVQCAGLSGDNVSLIRLIPSGSGLRNRLT